VKSFSAALMGAQPFANRFDNSRTGAALKIRNDRRLAMRVTKNLRQKRKLDILLDKFAASFA